MTPPNAAMHPVWKIAPLTLFAACSGFYDPARTATLGGQSVVLVDDVNASGFPRDAITLDSARITDDGRLRLFTKYGGGCAEHDAALLVSRTFLESLPPILRARIAHDGNGDNCKALISREFAFDLTLIREHYQSSYGSRAGAVVLDIGGERVTYVFR